MIKQDCLNIEQGSDEWKLARLGYVTASNIDAVMAKGKGISRKNYLNKVVAERLSGLAGESYSNSAMEWGVQTEPLARIAYEVSRETLVEQIGFYKHPTIQFVGVSPDGLVGDDGLVEIKCPNTTTHIDYIDNGKVPSEYYKQIQCQLWVTGRQWCDFISFDPRIKRKLFVIRANRDEELIKEMEAEVLLFLQDVQNLYVRLENE
jgi:putative phage-type endonuclease